MRRGGVVVVASVMALAAALGGQAGEDDVTFVNGSSQAMTVVVRAGSSGETGTCDARPNRSVFDLSAGEKKEVRAEGGTVCYCSLPAKDGPPKADTPDHGCTWSKAGAGDTVEIR
jgi:hypothetical protein